MLLVLKVVAIEVVPELASVAVEVNVAAIVSV
jgi:hypothetical protein